MLSFFVGCGSSDSRKQGDVLVYNDPFVQTLKSKSVEGPFGLESTRSSSASRYSSGSPFGRGGGASFAGGCPEYSAFSIASGLDRDGWSSIWTHCLQAFRCVPAISQTLESWKVERGQAGLEVVLGSFSDGDAGANRSVGVFLPGSNRIFLREGQYDTLTGCRVLLHEWVHRIVSYDASEESVAHEFPAYYFQNLFEVGLILQYQGTSAQGVMSLVSSRPEIGSRLALAQWIASQPEYGRGESEDRLREISSALPPFPWEGAMTARTRGSFQVYRY